MEHKDKNYAGIVLAAIAASLAAGPAHGFAPTGTAKLVPHRAVYEMTLDGTQTALGISGVQGRMVFDFDGSDCDGYTMNMRLVTRIQAQSGRSSLSDLQSSTWEQGAGKIYRFNTRHYLGKSLEESTRGNAKRSDRDGALVVHVTTPKTKQLKVDGPVLFPTQHSLEILAAAQAGKKIFQARVYDGSSNGRKVYATTTFVGKRLEPGAKPPSKRVANDEVLVKLVSWPISISYFDTGAEAKETPAYQLSFRLYNNGVSRELLIDYGDFSIKGELSSLEIRPFPGCK